MEAQRPDTEDQAATPVVDPRQPYVAPILETLDGQLSALLGSTQCGATSVADPG